MERTQRTRMLTSKSYIALIIGVVIRYILYFAEVGELMKKRVEVTVPTNSWLIMLEGIHLQKQDVDPYAGDTFHGTPLALWIFDALIECFTPFALFSIFVLMDLVTAMMIGCTAETFKTVYMIKSQLLDRERMRQVLESSENTNSVNSNDLIMKSNDHYGDWTLMAYFLNPFIIANCLGQTTTIMDNLILSITVLLIACGNSRLTPCILALSVYQSLYPIVLVFPAAICIHSREKEEYLINGPTRRYGCFRHRPSLFFVGLKISVQTFLAVGCLVQFSHFLCNFDYTFLDRTYGFILFVRDLKPNIGLFWYFFTEMFEHFHYLFICTFQINAFIYVIPLSVRFHDQPPLLIYSLLALMTIFKSYPCVGDVGFYMAFLPMWKHIFPFMQQKFLVACFFIATAALAPTQWYLWIYDGSANANFYFGVTIAFGTSQIFLLTDILLAHLKREYFLRFGIQKTLNGKPVGLSLM